MKNLLIILGIFISTLSFSQVDNATFLTKYTTFYEYNRYSDEFEIDMTTIVNTDIEDKESRLKLEGHLKNKDFFNVNEHKTASLMITTVKLIEESSYEYKQI